MTLFAFIKISVIFVLKVLLGVANRERAKTDTATGKLQLRYGGLYRGFAIFAAFGIPFCITVLLIVAPQWNKDDLAGKIAMYLLFAGLGLPLFWESSRFSCTVSSEGLNCNSPWRGTRFIAWTQIKKLSYNPFCSWFIIRTIDGYKFRIHNLASGIPQFLDECDKHLPPGFITKAKEGYLNHVQIIKNWR